LEGVDWVNLVKCCWVDVNAGNKPSGSNKRREFLY